MIFCRSQKPVGLDGIKGSGQTCTEVKKSIARLSTLHPFTSLDMLSMQRQLTDRQRAILDSAQFDRLLKKNLL